MVKLLTTRKCRRGKGTIALAQKVTLKQIANEVGLSPSSVSLVLNNRPCRISEENRRRIKEVAAREHYVPNQIARSLVMRESKTLGLIVPNIESRFFSSLAKNLEQRCRAEGYALFNTNPHIVTSIATEDEQNAYFDAEIEPVLKQLSGEYTRKLFSRRERGCGNRIVFEASAWDFASTSTKLNILQMVDRGALTPNEWRRAFNLAPVDGGDKPIRRLDTQPVDRNTTQKGDETT